MEDWSTWESEWKKNLGSSAPLSLFRLPNDLWWKIIEEYKDSSPFVDKLNSKTANEFIEGFEYAKEMVWAKGFKPEEVGIVDPE